MRLGFLQLREFVDGIEVGTFVGFFFCRLWWRDRRWRGFRRSRIDRRQVLPIQLRKSSADEDIGPIRYRRAAHVGMDEGLHTIREPDLDVDVPVGRALLQFFSSPRHKVLRFRSAEGLGIHGSGIHESGESEKTL